MKPLLLIQSSVDLALMNLTLQSLFVTCRYCNFELGFIFRPFETESRDIVKEVPSEMLAGSFEGNSIGPILYDLWEKNPILIIPSGAIFLDENWLPNLLSNFEKRDLALLYSQELSLEGKGSFPSTHGLWGFNSSKYPKMDFLKTLPQIALGYLFYKKCKELSLMVGEVDEKELGIHTYDSAIPFGPIDPEGFNWKEILNLIEDPEKKEN